MCNCDDEFYTCDDHMRAEIAYWRGQYVYTLPAGDQSDAYERTDPKAFVL